MRQRLAARDRFLAPLVRERDEIIATATDVGATLGTLVDRLVAAERTLQYEHPEELEFLIGLGVSGEIATLDTEPG